MWTDRRLLVVVCGVSLLLNLFLAGLLAGHGLAPRHRAASFGGGPVVRQANVSRLSAEDRVRFNAAMSAERPAIRAARETLRLRRRAVEAALVAPHYDRDAVVAGFDALRVAETDVAGKLHAALAGAMAELPQAARAALIARGPAPGGKETGGKPSDGKPSDGKASDGKASDGKASDGKASDGKASDGKAPGGKAPGGK